MNKFDEHIQNLVALCSRIGKIQLENQSSLKIKTKSDKSPVTNIDLLSNDIIVDYLLSNFPDDIVISEENIDNTKRDNSYWVVDPIDGTKDYIKGGGQFCICISYIENNYPVFGIIYIPSTKEFYYAIQGNGSYLIREDKGSIRLPSKMNINDCIFLSTSVRESILDILGNHFPTSDRVFMSSAIKFSKIAEGSGHFSVRLGPTYEWDTAAGQCIVEESGGLFLDKNLKRFSYGAKDNFLNGPFFVINGNIGDYKETISQCLSLTG